MISTIQHLGTLDTYEDFKKLRSFWKKNPKSNAIFICYKFVKPNSLKSWYKFTNKPITYTVGTSIKLRRDRCDASNKECGAGINVADKLWVKNLLDHSSTQAISMECAVKDIVAMPLFDGKFRVCKVKVLQLETL